MPTSDDPSDLVPGTKEFIGRKADILDDLPKQDG